MEEEAEDIPPSELLNAFRVHYYRFHNTVQSISPEEWDSVTLARLGDDLDEYIALVNEHSAVFTDTSELDLLRTNLAVMQGDIRLLYQQELDQSHHGRPDVIQQVQGGGRGRPRTVIDEAFLRWAYPMRTTSSIAHFLNVSRQTVRNALLQYGIVQPQANPFHNRAEGEETPVAENTQVEGGPADVLVAPSNYDSIDELLDPTQTPPPVPFAIPSTSNTNPTPPGIISYTGPLSNISDEDLDSLIRAMRQQYVRAGISMLDGMLRSLGYRIPRQRIRTALLRVCPVQRVFERILIRRCVYSVAGPNALWHHDGQHGLIRWGIVIHGFIDGYSRLITGLQASDNNRGATVLELFHRAAAGHGVPSRIRGDHGVENIQLAAWMEAYWGERRGSYIWGRSVHNVRIERLWVDVTVQVGAAWADAFTLLELSHGLDINNSHHIWLLHFLFLPAVNQQLAFFAQSWNQHRIQIRNGPNRSPADMFGFDMLVHGIRGSQLPEENLTLAELEVYGIDWAALRDEAVLQSIRSRAPAQNTGDGSSWIGHIGPPAHLNEVPLEPPEVSLEHEQLQLLESTVAQWTAQQGNQVSIISLWVYSLALARLIYGDIF